jgi:hypothetical protein
MAIGMSSGAPLLSLIMFCVLTTSYCWYFAETSPRQPFALSRPGPRMHGDCSGCVAGKLCSSAELGMPCSKIFPKPAPEPSPFQAQQRWAEHIYHPSLPLIITASYPAPVPPTNPFHRSAHRYCAWNPPRNRVKTSEHDGLRGGRFQPGAPRCVPSITYARPKLVWATNIKAGLAIAGPGFHPVSSVPCRHGDAFFLSLSRPMPASR